MAERSLLLVDGDSRRRRALEVGLRRARFRVTVAGSPEQALWFLDHAVPGAIVSSASFPEDSDGGQGLAEVVRSRPGCSEVAFVMMIDEGVGDVVLPTALADDVIVHAPTIAELVERLNGALRRRTLARLRAGETRELHGELQDVTPIDLLGLIEELGESGTLRVSLGERSATLWFAQGRIIDAVCGRFEAEDAVFRLLLHEAGAFELKLAPIVRGEVIRASMANLIGESLRRLDEWMRLCEEVPLEGHLWVDHELLAARRDTLGAEQLALIRSCDGRRRVRDIVEESGRDLLLALEALRNLRADGVLVDHPEPSAAPSEELPPLPAFPEPFPGIASDAEVDVDAPLVSGIPDEHPDDAGASGRFRDQRYVFRPPADEPGTLADRFREVSERESGMIGRAIADAIGEGEPQPRTPWRLPSRPLSRASAGAVETPGPGPTAPMAKVAEVAEPAANSGLEAEDAQPDATVAEVEVAEVDLEESAPEPSPPMHGPAEVLREALASAEQTISAEVRHGVPREDRTTLPDMLVPDELLERPSDGADAADAWSPPTQEGPSFDEWESFAAEESDAPATASRTEPAQPRPIDEDDEPTRVAKVLPLLRERRMQRRSVRVPAINGSVSPPKGLTRAESAGEILGESAEVTRVSSVEEAMSSATQRPSILVHLSEMPHSSGAHPVYARSTAATASGLIAGEIVDGAADSPAERSANLLLLTESRDDFGRLNAMAGMFSAVTSRDAVDLPPPLPPPTGYVPPPAPIDDEEIRLPARFSPRVVAALVIVALAISAWVFRDRLLPGSDGPPSPEAPSGPPVVISAMTPPGVAESAGEDRPSSATPEEVEAIVAEAERLHRRGAVEASFEVARALARDPKHGPALVLRAKIALDRGDLAAAREAADVAVAEHPELAEAHLTSAVIHEEQGARADAIAAYKRYLELAPDSRYASGVRRKIYRLRRKLSE